MAPEVVADPRLPAGAPVEYPPGLVAPTQRRRSQSLIGDVIVDLGFARREVVDAAVAMSREQGRMTGDLLVESEAIRPDQLARALAERFGVDYVDLTLFPVDPDAVALLDIKVARRYRALPIGFLSDGAVVLAAADPTNVLIVDEMAMITGRRMHLAAAAKEDITTLIQRFNREQQAEAEISEDELETEIQLNDRVDVDAPAVKLVHQVVAQAVETGASDIHFDPEDGEMKVLFRVDGVLTLNTTLHKSMAASVISRIKIMAGLDIAERRVPQDGRIRLSIEDRRIDARVVTLPLVGGECVVMRILDTGAVVRDLESLGMSDEERARLVAAIGRPYGTVLVTGPTGSGKSTTVYSALTLINDGDRSIITIEDPVESPIEGIKQMQVALKAGVTFAAGLRSILRADPDVIMVGEIRDRETATIAVQAAMTGHLMLSTLHTRDAPSAVTRLLDMGIEPFLAASAIDCVVAQRLMRTLCRFCKAPATLDDEIRAEYGLGDGPVFAPHGCMRCGGTGYHGRIGIYEVMSVTEEIRSLVIRRAGVDEIAAAALTGGMRRMRDDAMAKVRDGITSLAEATRVTATV
jgi:type IV pilus assembly protein PilB